MQTPTSGLFLKQAGWQNGKNVRNVHSGSVSNLILENTHSVTIVPVRMARARAGCNCALWFRPKKSSFPSLPWVPDNSAERHQSSDITEGSVTAEQDPGRSDPDHPCLAHCKLFTSAQKKAQGWQTTARCTGPDVIQRAGSTSIVLDLENTCQ